MFEQLTHKNFALYTAKHYQSDKYYTDEDYINDLNRIKYIKKLITRYVENGELRERLILNHIIILNNSFTPIHLSKILYLKLKSQMRYIKPFLVSLNIMQDTIYNVDGETVINTDEIDMDEHIVMKLRELLNAGRK